MNITLHSNGKCQVLQAAPGSNLLELLRENGQLLSAVCGGNRSCGKCKIRVLSPDIPPSESDRRLLREEDLRAGIRLSCTVTVEQDMELELLSDMIQTQQYGTGELQQNAVTHAVVDIGTTTIAAVLTDESGNILRYESRHNAQAVYAADVIGRIREANAGKREKLTQALRQQLAQMLENLLQGTVPQDITVCGNTVMLHLFFGAECTTLGSHPYTPVFLGEQAVSAQDIGIELPVQVQSLPCISVFTGADITAGILAEYGKAEGYTLLLDLGTNAELALFDQNSFVTSSAAAGPVFEGGNIQQGMAATGGAITRFWIEKGENNFETFGGVPACGICGSGLIDIISQLLEHELADASGRLLTGESYIITDGIAITAEDIRAVQLAKAAIAAAAELLLRSANISYADVGRVAISGGLGSAINPQSAAAIGLIPKELLGKTVAAGNSSLSGGILYACSQQARELAKRIASEAPYLDLSKHPDFMDLYIDHMYF